MIDTSPATGQNWSLLHRACLAIFQACQQQQKTAGGAWQCGLLLINGRGMGPAPLTIPSGFTDDDAQFRRWLRGMLFDDEHGNGAHLEALLVALQGEPWAPGAAKHIVLVTHTEPRALPASVAALAGVAGGALDTTDAASCWAPIPELFAASGSSLSLVAPRAMPRLAQLHAAVCAATGTEPPLPTLFAEAEQLFVVSALLPSPSAGVQGAPSPRTSAPSPGVSEGASAVGDVSHGGDAAVLDPWLPQAKRRATAAGKGREASKTSRRIQSNASAGAIASAATQAASSGPTPVVGPEASARDHGPRLLLWDGGLSASNHDLGKATLTAEDDGTGGKAAQWQSVAAREWGSTLQVIVVDHAQRAALLQKLPGMPPSAKLVDSGPAPSATMRAAAILLLRLHLSKRKAAELFETLRSKAFWALLPIPTAGHGIVIDASESSSQGLRGWLLPMPNAPHPSAPPSSLPSAAGAAEPPTMGTARRAASTDTSERDGKAAANGCDAAAPATLPSVTTRDGGSGSSAVAVPAASAAAAPPTPPAPSVLSMAPAPEPSPTAAPGKVPSPKSAGGAVVLGATHIAQPRPSRPARRGAGAASRPQTAVSMATASGSSEQPPFAAAPPPADPNRGAAAAAAMSDVQYETLAATLDGPARALFDGLRRKLRDSTAKPKQDV